MSTPAPTARRQDAPGYRLVWRLAAVLAAIVLVAMWREHRRAVPQPPGVLAPEAPLQLPLEHATPKIERKSFRIVPQARFALRARVLGREDYFSGKESELSPTDLVLGWGRMSDTSVLAGVEISQSSRWYRWYTSDPAIPMREIEQESANMHLIPADPAVAARLARVREGELVSLSGYLVDVLEPESGWTWRSSLTRDDTGAGSCELVYVESLE